MGRPTAIVATGQTDFVARRMDVSMPEMIREAVDRCLESKGLRLSDVDAVVVGKFAHDDRIEASVANKPFGDANGLRIVAGDRNSKLRIGAVRFAREDFVVERVERANNPRARQIFLRNDANPLFLDLVSDGSTVARGDRVTGVEHDLAVELDAVVLADLRQRAIGNGNKENIAKHDCFINGSGFGNFAQPGGKVLQLF